jgi:hypothetical protein
MHLSTKARARVTAIAAGTALAIAGGVAAEAASAQGFTDEVTDAPPICATCGTHDGPMPGDPQETIDGIGVPDSVVVDGPPPPPAAECAINPAACAAIPEPNDLPGHEYDDIPWIRYGGTWPDEGDEGTREALVVITLHRATQHAVSFDWTTRDGTAQAGTDYVATSGHVRFEAGETEKTVSIPVLGDRLHEARETFAIQLSSIRGGEYVSTSGEAVVIVDDDRTPPAVSIEDTSVTEGAGPARFRVSLSEPSGAPAVIAYTTVEGTAVFYGDYNGPNVGELTFAPGETVKEISIHVEDDRVQERSEDFKVRLTGASAATIARGEATATILDNEPLPVAGAAQVNGQQAVLAVRPTFRGLLARRSVRLGLSCPAGGATCTGKVRLIAGSLTAGGAAVSLDAGETRVMTIALSRRARRLLARHRRLRVTAHTVLRGFADEAVADSSFTVRLARAGLNPQPLPPRSGKSS